MTGILGAVLMVSISYFVVRSMRIHIEAIVLERIEWERIEEEALALTTDPFDDTASPTSADSNSGQPGRVQTRLEEQIYGGQFDLSAVAAIILLVFLVITLWLS